MTNNNTTPGDKYVVLDEQGRSVGFYDSNVNGSSIPTNAVKISYAVWQQWIAAQLSGQELIYNASTGGLSTYNPPPPTKAELLTYAYAKQSAVASGGVTVNVGTSEAPIEVTTSTDAQGQNDLTSAAVLATLNPSQVFDWVEDSGTVQLTGAQIITLGVGVGVFRQLTFTILGGLVSGINSGGVTNYAQIDTPTEVGLQAWPPNAGMQAKMLVTYSPK